MKKILCVFLVLIMCISPLNAFADEFVPNDIGFYEKYKDQNISINVYNWGEYISDGSEGSMDVNMEFEKLTGIKVNYTTFSTNEEMYAKLKSGGVNYDIVIPSDYMINRMIEEDMLLKLDHNNIPNAKNIMDRFKGLEYDSDNEYSLPYTWGAVGIFYNTSMVDEEIDSWNVFWDQKYKDNMMMFSNSRDAFGIAQKYLGYSYNTEDRKELDSSLAALQEQKPLIQAYVMDEIFDKMAGGEVAIAPYYNGDAKIIIEDNPEIKFVFPKEGTNLFVDAMCIPKNSQNKQAAELYINFMLEPDVGVATTEYIGYATPNQASYDLLDDETKNDSIFYPSDDILENTEVYLNLSKDTNDYLTELWAKLMKASSEGDRENVWLVPIILLGAIAFVIVFNLLKRRRKRNQSNYM